MILLLACHPPEPVESPPPADTADTAPAEGAIAGVSAALHAEVSTIVVVSWTQLEATDASWIEFSFEDELMSTPVVAREAGAASEVLLGAPPDTEVSFVVHSGDEASAETPVTTGSVPEGLPVPTVAAWDPTSASPERWMIGTIDAGNNWYYGPYWAFILDRQGRYVWWWEVPDNRCALYAQPGWDGSHLFVDANTQYVWDDEVVPGFFRLTLDFAWFEEVQVPNHGFAIDELTDGAVLFESRADGAELLARRDADGTETVIWSCTEYLPTVGGTPNTCGPNTIVWDPERDTALWSMYLNDTVLEIDLGTGEVLKQFGQIPGGWTFDPPESVVDYQHYVNWSDDGTLVISTHIRDVPDVQRTREFEVDEEARTLREIWTFGEDVDHYARYAGEAFRLENRNTIVGYGTDGVVIETTMDEALAWDVEWPTEPNSHLVGHMTMVDDLYALNAGQ